MLKWDVYLNDEYRIQVQATTHGDAVMEAILALDLDDDAGLRVRREAGS
ncbi:MULTISPECIES: hypothetical protein [Pseudomonas aeruginosa group]|nr:hypothetical protein [Pseudomonas aeruginosa]EKU8569375.1 hypothetical protein [Pseudomonas aeruginosa]EKX5463441.1 hypothetical protein [Pseudomonas aeruginosa]MCT2384456.1 hypothetical protein [Pseudomonas aeruginosa]MCV0105399.1 hypothetical protein [Pseudomonas aeruginosa]MDQ2500317.1 hypothetical protein [Pseudomonas aeruginosa]